MICGHSPELSIQATGSAIVTILLGGVQSLRCLYQKQIKAEIMVCQCSRSRRVYSLSFWSSELFKSSEGTHTQTHKHTQTDLMALEAPMSHSKHHITYSCPDVCDCAFLSHLAPLSSH